MKIKGIVITPVLLLFLNVTFAQEVYLSTGDFKAVVGCWQGKLTYVDYSTNKPFSMPANADIRQIGNVNAFTVAFTYPNEPNANSNDTITISADGKFVNKESVKSKRILADGSLEIITELAGVDGNDNKQATFRYTYILSTDTYSHKKEVRFAGSNVWITRHEYSYKRCK